MRANKSFMSRNKVNSGSSFSFAYLDTVRSAFYSRVRIFCIGHVSVSSNNTSRQNHLTITLIRPFFLQSFIVVLGCKPNITEHKIIVIDLFIITPMDYMPITLNTVAHTFKLPSNMKTILWIQIFNKSWIRFISNTKVLI